MARRKDSNEHTPREPDAVLSPGASISSSATRITIRRGAFPHVSFSLLVPRAFAPKWLVEHSLRACVVPSRIKAILGTAVLKVASGNYHRGMEAFEHVCRIALESEGFAVSSNVKFPVRLRTKKKKRKEEQTHGIEIDLIGARAGALVLGSVKSFFGSKGVQAKSLSTKASDDDKKRYRLFHDRREREQVVAAAAKRYGYEVGQVELRLYVGQFKAGDESLVRKRVGAIKLGARPASVVGPSQIRDWLDHMIKSKTYVDDPVVATLRLFATGAPRG
jgi:hypothetical protein